MKSAVIISLGVVLLLLVALFAYTCGGEQDPQDPEPYFSDEPQTEMPNEGIQYRQLPDTGGIRL